MRGREVATRDAHTVEIACSNQARATTPVGVDDVVAVYGAAASPCPRCGVGPPDGTCPCVQPPLGWRCPGCLACYAPSVTECSRCVPVPYGAVTVMGPVCACGSRDANHGFDTACSTCQTSGSARRDGRQGRRTR